MQELSLVARPTRSPEHPKSLLNLVDREEKLLRCAAIYGSNASGKSNILRAMRTFSRMVSDSQRNWKPTGGVRGWDPFAFDEMSTRGETTFEADFSVGNLIYRYGFRFSEKAFVAEWLLDTTGRTKILFKRDSSGSDISVSLPAKNLGANSDESRHLESIRSQTRPNSLFLSAAAQGNYEKLLPIYKWIVESFHVVSPRDDPQPRYTAIMCSDLTKKEQVKALLSFADVGIVDLEVSEEQVPEKVTKVISAMFAAMKEVEPDSPATLNDLSTGSQHSIRMMHKGARGQNFPIDFSDESAGTRAFFYLLGPLLSELKDGTVLLIDEFGSSFHPNLAKHLVKMFNDPSFNGNGAQIVFATHDTKLLDPELLRRDQIWFTEKDQEGATSLSQLSQYKVRKDQNVEAAYLHGRFGAVPFLDDEFLRTFIGSAIADGPEEVFLSSGNEPIVDDSRVIR